MILLASCFFIVGSVTSLKVIPKENYHEDDFLKSGSINPNSEVTLQNVTVDQPYLQLGVYLNSSESLKVDVNYNGSNEYSTEGSQIKSHFMLVETGNWTIMVRNNNTDSVSLNCIITLTTATFQTQAPFLNLLSPSYVFGEITLTAVLPLNFYDDIKKRWNKRTTEIFTLSIVALLGFGFMPILSLVAGTSSPLVTPGTTSMVPTIQPGDLVLLKGEDPNNLVVGDIICYNALTQHLDEPSTPITPYPIIHRIVQIITANETRFFVTKGDDNPVADTWYVPQDAVVGKEILIIPYIGKIFAFISQLYVKIILIVVILTIIAVWPTKKNKTDKARGEKNEQKNQKETPNTI
jgi:signal peptidase